MMFDPGLKIEDLIQQGDLWVINTATNPQRVLALTVFDRSGRATAFLIPDTPHPVHLSNHLPTNTLLECADVRRFIQNGALTIVAPDKAAEYYAKNPQAYQALTRAYAKVQNTALPIPKQALAQADVNGKGNTEDAADESRVGGTAKTQMDANGVNRLVRGIVDSVNQGTITSDDGLLDLANIAITAADLNYIAATDKKGPLREFAKAQRGG